MLGAEATNANFIVYGLTRSTTLEACTLTITPPMWFKTFIA